MQHHVGRTGGVGTRIVADDGVEAEQGFDEIGFEAVVEHVARRSREEIEQAALLLQRKTAQDSGGADGVDEFARGLEAESLGEVWRRAEYELTDDVGNLFEFAHEVVEYDNVPFAQAGH